MVQNQNQALLSPSDKKQGFFFLLHPLKYFLGMLHINTETKQLPYSDQTLSLFQSQ